jgi:hypothetical protein
VTGHGERQIKTRGMSITLWQPWHPLRRKYSHALISWAIGSKTPHGYHNQRCSTLRLLKQGVVFAYNLHTSSCILYPEGTHKTSHSVILC